MAPQFMVAVSNTVAYGGPDLARRVEGIDSALAAVKAVVDHDLTPTEERWVEAIPAVTWIAIRDALVTAWDAGWQTSFDVVYQVGANFTVEIAHAPDASWLGVILKAPPPEADTTTSD